MGMWELAEKLDLNKDIYGWNDGPKFHHCHMYILLMFTELDNYKGQRNLVGEVIRIVLDYLNLKS